MPCPARSAQSPPHKLSCWIMFSQCTTGTHLSQLVVTLCRALLQASWFRQPAEG
jgi:hypothetical protein